MGGTAGLCVGLLSRVFLLYKGLLKDLRWKDRRWDYSLPEGVLIICQLQQSSRAGD